MSERKPGDLDVTLKSLRRIGRCDHTFETYVPFISESAQRTHSVRYGVLPFWRGHTPPDR
jgi:hypothetical protein